MLTDADEIKLVKFKLSSLILGSHFYIAFS